MNKKRDTGTGSAKTALQRALTAIEGRESEVHAFTHLDPEGAQTEAARIDKAREAGPLTGRVLAVKDLIDTADMPTAYGSPIYAGHRPAWDAPAVGLARRAGAVVIGKTVTTEFAYLHPGETRNPHNLEHTPGGSSSGSAAAVAAGMADLALGTQTGGSVIRPASYCGVVGYKPTFGMIPTVGVKTFAWSLDTVGVFARTVEEAALCARVLASRTLPAEAPSRPPRLGVYRPPNADEATPAAGAALDEARRRAEAAGAEIVDVAPPAIASRLDAAWKAIHDFEGARALLFEYDNHRDDLSDKLRESLERGFALPASDYDSALATAAEARAGLMALFADADAVLTFAAPGEAPEGIGSTGDSAFNRVWTMAGMPAVTVPGLTGEAGLPVGVQVLAPRHGDRTALSVAAWLHPLLDTALAEAA